MYAFAAAVPGISEAGWRDPFPPHRVVGNVYYVGSKALATYLITTPEGHILINANLAESVPQIRAGVEKLGFKFGDIKILLVSHGHWDHIAGSAELIRQTGAKYMVMDRDVAVIESGGKEDFHYGAVPGAWFEPVKVDRALRDGDEVKLGGSVLIARLTPGHTKGCTTWTMKVSEGGRQYDVVIIGSPNVNDGFRLLDNAKYPGIADDYLLTFKVLKSLPCDVFLGAHGDYYRMQAKYPRLAQGGENPFIDPEGYKAYVAAREAAFRAELRKQEAQAGKAAGK
jgi:metallo-beta-lactamase class B